MLRVKVSIGFQGFSGESSSCFLAVRTFRVKPRKDGKPLIWQKHCKLKRDKLGVEEDVRPWSARQDVKLQGIARQLSVPNFVGELLDVHLMMDNCRLNKPLGSDPRDDLMVDITQDLQYQTQCGPACLLGDSRLYFYSRDRTGAPEENLRLNGWGDDVDSAAVDEDIIGTMRELVSGPQKRRKGKKVLRSTKVRDLAGNGECLPDLSSIAIPVIYCMNAGYFAKTLTMGDISFGDISGMTSGPSSSHEAPLTIISIPVDISQEELAQAADRSFKVASAVGVDAGGEEGEEDEEDD